ncbi:MAG: helix-turn-helix transcriptional regulator [Clostridia bacterium]|nr:helix-turn-helix transcriptional regulator [Clostridia bacterium]MBQ9946567.1 helix-turn-helix transcriptional regulator [Clostridia bacterium]
MKKNINLEIGERVRLTRVARGFSREELAEYLGISTLFLGYIECGQRGMSLGTMQNMCKILNVSADYLLMGTKNSENIYQDIYNAIVELDSKYYPLAIDSINNLKRMITIAEMKSKEM